MENFHVDLTSLMTDFVAFVLSLVVAVLLNFFANYTRLIAPLPLTFWFFVCV
jgi:hypothetical protein